MLPYSIAIRHARTLFIYVIMYLFIDITMCTLYVSHYMKLQFQIKKSNVFCSNVKDFNALTNEPYRVMHATALNEKTKLNELRQKKSL